MAQSAKQFDIRSLMIAFVMVAVSLLQIRQFRSIEAGSGGIREGPWIQRIGAHESRDAIEEWLLTNGFSVESRPSWSKDFIHTNEKWFVDNANHPSMHVRLAASDDRLLATFCYRKYSWRFIHDKRDDVFRQKSKALLAWWREYTSQQLDQRKKASNKLID